jgi:hypothetical protein
LGLGNQRNEAVVLFKFAPAKKINIHFVGFATISLFWRCIVLSVLRQSMFPPRYSR